LQNKNNLPQLSEQFNKSKYKAVKAAMVAFLLAVLGVFLFALGIKDIGRYLIFGAFGLFVISFIVNLFWLMRRSE